MKSFVPVFFFARHVRSVFLYTSIRVCMYVALFVKFRDILFPWGFFQTISYPRSFIYSHSFFFLLCVHPCSRLNFFKEIRLLSINSLRKSSYTCVRFEVFHLHSSLDLYTNRALFSISSPRIAAYIFESLFYFRAFAISIKFRDSACVVRIFN